MALLRNPETPHYALRDAVMEEEPPVARVYVVVGACGEHEDYGTWFVAAYLDEDQAKSACKRLTDWCVENRCSWNQKRHERQRWLVDLPRCPLDPNQRYDHRTGVGYEVEEIPLLVEET